MKLTRRLAPRIRGCCGVALLLGAGCGVRDYPHEIPLHDAAKDFAPTSQSRDQGGDVQQVNVDRSPDASSAPEDVPQAATGRDAGEPAAADAAVSSADERSAVGDDLVLGDAHLHKEDVLAFIHIGHSNMSGHGVDPDELRSYNFTDINPRAWKYHVGSPPEPAIEPTSRTDREPYAGPGTSLVKQAAERAPGKYTMSLGFGSSGIYCTQFLPGGLYYESATKAAIAIKDRVTFVAIVLMLGSTEIHGTDADRANFPECINKLVSAVRKAVGQPDLPVLLSGYELNATGIYAADGPFATQIIPQIARVPSVVANSAVVSAEGLGMQDDHHFNLSGHKVWTARVLDTMKAKGWAPWMTK